MRPRLFFSWQSDISAQTNDLRAAIRKALKEVKRLTGVDYILDEATRDRPGSPDIKQTIMAKIEDASIFVADVTTVTSTSAELPRHHSNSNVMFELGYATAILGSDRIIQIARPPVDSLPFDIKGNRTTLLDSHIVEHLSTAVAAIQRHNPPSIFERRIAEPARRMNLRVNVEGYMSNLPPALLADSIERLPQTFDRRLASVFDDLSARRQRPDKLLPDDLQDLFDDFHCSLNGVVQLGADNFLETSSSLVRLPKLHENRNADQVRDEAEQLKQTLRSAHEIFVKAAKRDFPDISFDQIGHEADRLYAGES